MSSADDESEPESGEEFTLWDIKENLDSEPFDVVLKGGSPWGFTLTGGAEVRSPIQITEILQDGKADQSGLLQVGDFLLGVNGIKCVSQIEAVELIKGAFRTVTLTIWRGTSKLESSVKVLRSSSFLQKAREAQERERSRLGIQDDSIVQKDPRMKQKPRRIESFHGSRTRSHHQHHHKEPSPSISSSTDASLHSYHTADSKEVKEGTSQQHDNRNSQQPMEQQVTTPTSNKVKEWPTMSDLSQQRPKQYDGYHGYHNTNLSPSKSSPNLDKEEPYNASRSVNYSSPLMNKSSPNIHDDVRKSSSSSLNSSNQKWSSPSAYHKSPRPYTNFYSTSYSKHSSNDYQNLQDIQQSINQSHVTSHGLTPPIEKEEVEPELQGLTKGDSRPLCSPPAPPTRDISSLKYVPLTSQSHAKYPSWPVTQPSADTESGEPINAPLSVYNEQNINQNNVRSLKDRNSPNSDRKASDRNASDPGFKKPIPFAVFLKRPDQKQVQYGSQVETEKKDKDAKMDEFFESSPGYQQPIFDQDGHRIGDEKYNVSPPERESDGRNSSRSRKAKQDSRYVPQYKGYAQPRIMRDAGSNPILSPDRDSKHSFGNLYPDKASLQVSTDNKFIDSSTSPMQSPKQPMLPGTKDHSLETSMTQSNDPKMQSYIVNKKTMVCFNTGTQTEFNTPKKKSPVSPGFNSHFSFDKSHQAIQTSPENTNKDEDVHVRERPKSGHESRPRPKSTSEKDKMLLNNINSELDSNDQHSAPFMRKLARDLLANQNQEHKRRSTSSSGGSGLRSPSSDYSHYFGELKESESYSSVIIHDDVSEAETITSSRADVAFEKSKSARRSLDPSMFSQKISRSLQGNNYGPKEYTSMTNLSYSAREDSRPRTSRPSTDSSTPSQRTGSSTDTFSSTGTHYSFETTQSPYVPQLGHPTSRRESNDSVFMDEKSPFEKKGDSFKDFKSPGIDKRKSQNWVGRTQSMKKAYGTYDETQSWHKRNESEASSASSGDNHHNIIHGRSQSEYLPMDAIRKSSDKPLGAINEESSEARWQDALRRSQRSSQSSFDSDLDVKKHVNEKLREYQSREMERTNLKRTSSEQIRPMKEKLGNKIHSDSKLEDPKQKTRKDNDIVQSPMQRTNSRERLSPAQSQTDLRSQSVSDSSKMSSGRMVSPSSSRSDLRQDQENRKPPSPSQSRADLGGSREDLKRVQKSALQNFMLTKTGRLPSDEDSPSSPSDLPVTQNIPDRPTRLSVTESFRKKYAEGEKLRRSRSISSTDSGNYTEMRPPQRPQQTEWSRVRSQTRRPLSIGSDSGSSLVDPYAVTPITSSSLDHSRTPSDSLESPRLEQGSRDLNSSRDATPQSPRMGSSSIYQNLMQEQSGYRKPLPPPPPSEEDKPPELPPRNYRKEATQSDSHLLPPRQSHVLQQEESHDSYVDQLRKLSSRRYSEQQSAATMMYISSKTPQSHIIQSYAKPEVKAFEATQPQNINSPNTHEGPKIPAHHLSQQLYSANAPQPLSQVKNVSPSFNSHSSSSSGEIQHDLRQRPPSPRQSPTARPRNHRHSPIERQPSPQQQSPSLRQISPHHSPQSSILRQISSPEPPPPPTPIKEGLEFNQDLPPPPPEVLQEKDQINERFSDDSYLSQKTKGDNRPIGQYYKRSATTSDVTKISPETNNNKVEKPPRKRLQQPWQQSANQSEQNTDQSSVPRFSAAESRVNPNVIKSVAKPLDKNHVPPRPLGNSYSASALQTPRPFISANEASQKESHSAERPSVRDAISCYEKKSTPDRPERSQASKYSSSLFSNSRTSNERLDVSSANDSYRRLSHDNTQQNTDNTNASVHEGVSRLAFESDPMSPRRTSFPPDKVNLTRKYGSDQNDDKKQVSHSEYNGNVTMPEILHSKSYVPPSDRNNFYNRSNDHDSRNHGNNSKSHMSFNPSPEHRQFSENSANETQSSCHVRQRSQEELECDEKVSEIVKKDETLKQVLQVDNKGRMDFMNGIFPMEEPVRHHQSPRHSPQSSTVRHGDEVQQEEEQKSPLDPSSLPAGYFKSSPKAKIEMDMREKSEEFNQEVSKEIKDPDTLIKTKEELVRSIQKKVEKLKEGKNELQKELDEVDDMGRKVVKLVQEKCRTQQEKDKFSSYITDMEKIIKLLLKLSGLLARAENALQSLPDNSSPSVKKMAVDKRDRLQSQHEEAKTLKEDIDKRSAQVSTFLQECLSDGEFEDYKYFVQMKSKLTIEMQEFDDKITLGQEQILGLKRNIPDN